MAKEHVELKDMIAVSPAKAGAMMDRVSENVVKLYIRNGMLPAMELFGKYKIYVEDIHEFNRRYRNKSIRYADGDKTRLVVKDMDLKGA